MITAERANSYNQRFEDLDEEYFDDFLRPNPMTITNNDRRKTKDELCPNHVKSKSTKLFPVPISFQNKVCWQVTEIVG